MISQKMQDSINEQVKNELYSAYLYLSMSSWCQSADLPGFANWMRVQAQEELFHATKFFDYVISQDGRALLLAVDQPPHDFEAPQKMFEEVLNHEKKVTGMIYKLVDQAIAEKDHATNTMLQWFVNEQVEEESNAKQVLQKIKRVGKDASALFMIDQELAARVYTPPAAAGPAGA